MKRVMISNSFLEGLGQQLDWTKVQINKNASTNRNISGWIPDEIQKGFAHLDERIGGDHSFCPGQG